MEIDQVKELLEGVELDNNKNLVFSEEKLQD